MPAFSKKFDRPPAMTEDRNTCWAACLASLAWATEGNMHFAWEYLNRYKAKCTKSGALLGMYVPGVLRAEGLSHNVVQGQDFNIDDLYARMYGEAPVYHLLIFKHDEGFTHCVVIYGVQRDDLDRLYVMNPLYDLDDCYREMRVGEFCRAQGGNAVVVAYY